MKRCWMAAAASAVLMLTGGCWTLTEEAWLLGDRRESFRPESLRMNEQSMSYELDLLYPHTRLSGRPAESTQFWRSRGEVRTIRLDPRFPISLSDRMPPLCNGTEIIFEDGNFLPLYEYRGDGTPEEMPRTSAAIVRYIDDVDYLRLYAYNAETGKYAFFGEVRSREWTLWWSWPLKIIAIGPAFCCDLVANAAAFPVMLFFPDWNPFEG